MYGMTNSSVHCNATGAFGLCPLASLFLKNLVGLLQVV